MNDHTPDPAQTRSTLVEIRPDLVDGFDAALPGARATVLSCLWGALAREPLPGVSGQHRDGGQLHIEVTHGRRVSGPAAAAAPYAYAAAAGLRLHVDGTAHDDPAALLHTLALPGHTTRLAREVANSVANLALARAAQDGRTPALAELSGPDGSARAEQLVVDGHPLHPCRRTRTGMSTTEVLAYGPEHAPELRLHRYRVPADRWYGDGPPVLLVHPWQGDHVLDAYPWLEPHGRTGPVRPLMSLRTVAPVDGGDHVKTAVDVQMTSAVRTVSPAAVHNGPRLSALLRTLTADLPLDVLAEFAAGAVVVDGNPSRHLAHLRRQAPATTAGAVAVPLAVLTARPALLAEVVAGHGGNPYAWLTALTAAVLPPLLTVLDRGVALEAHGQNTLLVFHGPHPVRVLYRDLGGVRVSGARLRAHGAEVPPLHGELPSDDPAVLRTKLAAAVVAGVLADQIALLGRDHGADPDRLWAIVARAVRDTGTGDAHALLHDPLPVKATTVMRLADDPLVDVWAYQDNPMAVHG